MFYMRVGVKHKLLKEQTKPVFIFTFVFSGADFLVLKSLKKKKKSIINLD